MTPEELVKREDTLSATVAQILREKQKESLRKLVLDGRIPACPPTAVKADPHARVDSVGGVTLTTGALVTGTLAASPVYVGHATNQLRAALHTTQTERDRWKAKCEYWQAEAEKRSRSGSALDATKIADEIMARIERDGAIHRDALVEVVRAFGGPGPAPANAPLERGRGGALRHTECWTEVADDYTPIIEASAGSHIRHAIEDGIDLARKEGYPITVRFNGRLYRCEAGDTAGGIIDRGGRISA